MTTPEDMRRVQTPVHKDDYELIMVYIRKLRMKRKVVELQAVLDTQASLEDRT